MNLGRKRGKVRFRAVGAREEQIDYLLSTKRAQRISSDVQKTEKKSEGKRKEKRENCCIGHQVMLPCRLAAIKDYIGDEDMSRGGGQIIRS